MNSIGNSPQLDRAGLQSLADRLALDDPARHGAQLPTATPATDEATGLRSHAASAVIDAGEQALGVAAWDGFAGGQRMLSSDMALQGMLGRLDLPSAVDAGVDAVVAALG
ncbi:hypothetical protein INQ40_04775 [Lysobacter sp. H21R4]|uniref:hypothetical protein n=1 Tax=Lysobacter sp. H21R4 TaxID=2781021 RepID=UPI001888C141|nr:hypothetical protein [Lysobacter sp. H21R4]QOY63552.1 hypothetical protein INQ40_04775 [Lysobacter sp. H21R4]